MTTYTTKKLDTTGTGIAAAPGALADADLAIVGQSNDGNLYRTTLGAIKTFFETAYAALFVAKAGDTMTGPLLFSKTGSVQTNLNGVPSCKVQVRGEAGLPANFVFITEGVAGANAIGVLYRGSTDPPGFWGYKARGTEASPTAVTAGDGAVNLTGYLHTGSSFVRAGLINLTTIAATPSATDLESRWGWTACAAGSVSDTTLLAASHSAGLQMYAVGQTVITSNRLFRQRIFTVATLPVTGIAAGDGATVSDALAPAVGAVIVGGGAVFCDVRQDGINWRKT